MKKKSILVSYKKDKVKIPYIEVVGKKTGPHMFVSGGIHGNEINGVAIIKEILEWAEMAKLEKKLKGKLTIIPLLNPSGFEHNLRHVYEDRKDLNRQFGFEKPNCLSQQIAFDLTEKLLKKCDFGIDFHDSGKGAILIPHARVHKNDDLKCESCSREFARIFGTKIILERYGHPNMLAVSLNLKYNKPIITIEIGGDRRVFHNYHEVGVQGFRNVLIAMSMIKGKMQMPRKQYILHGRFGVKINKAAFIKFSKKLGKLVHQGETLGEIYYPNEVKTYPIVSPMCGILFSQWHRNIVKAGDVIYSILEIKKCHTKRTTLSKFEEMPKFGLTQMTL